MERLAGDKCCLLASLMLLLWSLLLGVKGASIFTHHCVINIDGEVQNPPVLQLHCQRLQQQATSHSSSRQPCNLKLFYNNTNITVPDPSTFGIDAGMLPVEGSEVPPYTQQVLNRTKEREQDGKMVQDVLWPLLYFHGGPGCNVLLERPVIRAMRRPYADKRATQALVFGGGLNATIAGGLFSNLSAASGIVVLARSRLHVKDTIINNNSVVKGVLYVSHSGSLLVENVTLSGNTAFAEGPALYIVQGFAMISSSTISGNAAQSGGGALYVKGGAKLVLFNSTFERNVAGKGEEAFGGVMHVTDSTVMVTDCNFTNNLATQGAGAIYIGLENQPADSEKCQYGDLPMRLEIRGCNFSGNLAPTGGALAVYYAAAMISNSSFTDNRARPVQVESVQLQQLLQLPTGFYTLGVGGAIYTDNAVLTVQDSSFTSNTAVMDGGALRMQRGHVNISNSNLTDNRAHRHGGAVFVGTIGKAGEPYAVLEDIKECYYGSVRPALLLSSCNVSGSTAEASGGALMLQPLGNVSVIDTTIAGSEAWHTGGGVCTELFLSNEDDNWGDYNVSQFPYDLQTQLIIGHNTILYDNRGSGRHLYVGPYFNLSFADSAKHGRPAMNASSIGVVWRKRVCGKGEYAAPSGFCEQCPSFTYRMSGNLHRDTTCPPAPNNTHAPGGAVIVPLTSNWHMVHLNTSMCAKSPSGNCAALKVPRCPNPAACKHDHKGLALRHPESAWANKHGWDEYSKLLCDVEQGYKGDLCGVCAPGYGMTAPFSCSRCQGAVTSLNVSSGELTSNPSASKVGLTGLYIFYWVALTAWCWFSVWSALPDYEQQTAAAGCAIKSAAASDAASAAASDAASGSRGADATAGTAAQTVDGGFNATGTVSACANCGALPDEQAEPLDVVKGIMVYYQWFSLVMNLPLIGFPDAVLAFTKRAEGSGFVAFMSGIIFGHHASLDCLLQAWGRWPYDTTQDYISRTFFISLVSAIVIPAVLLLSVLLVWVAVYAVRRYQINRMAFPCVLPFRCCGTVERDSSANKAAGNQLSMGAFVIQRFAITWLVLFFDNYDKTAQTALGMLFCVDVGADPYPRRWVLDVRLPCPSEYRSDGWSKAAIAIGVILLLICFCIPVLLASWLATRVYRGVITSEGEVEADDPSLGMVRLFLRRSLRNVMLFRYADYNVQYALLRRTCHQSTARTAVVTSSTEPLHAEGGQVASVEPSGCRLKLRRFVRSLALHRLQLWAVLSWDSILDMHRLLLALVALSVMMHELHQLLLVIMVLSSYLALILAVKPYRCITILRLQVLALLVLLLSCFGIAACNIGDTSGFYNAAVKSNYMDAVPWVVAALNMLYLLTAGAVLVVSVWHKRGWCRGTGCAIYLRRLMARVFSYFLKCTA